MGADLLLTWVDVEKGGEPDFGAARRAVDGLDIGALAAGVRDDYWADYPDALGVAKAMKAEIDKLEQLWLGGSREMAHIEVRGADLLFTGGLNCGEGPTDAFDVIERVMTIPGALAAAGFTE